jgi:basic amino acid/polyamine antiporter, APA family
MKTGRLSLAEAVGLIVSLVIGVGIFKTPSLVAANVSTSLWLILLWAGGGAVSLLGALCYAELATAYPHPGGEYYYIGRAFGKSTAFLFGWSRMMVIQAGSIAMLAFIFGDYVAQLFRYSGFSPSVWAASSVGALTVLNVLGVRNGKWTQNILSIIKILGLCAIVFAGVLSTHHAPAVAHDVPITPAALGLAMVFVLLTYGGWNEAAYISSELRNVRHNMVKSLVWGVLLITVIYVLINLVFVKVLGLQALRGSEAAAWDTMNRIAGARGALLITIFVSISALGSMNATMITGARSNFALAREFALFEGMARWDGAKGGPVGAIVVQGAIALSLVLLGALTRDGFVTVVEYMTPVFWFFFLLATISLIILRWREPEVVRSFTVPFYPVTPLLFGAVCLCMLVSSLAYTGVGALIGVAVLAAGVPFLLISLRYSDKR